jgi:YtkA-like
MKKCVLSLVLFLSFAGACYARGLQIDKKIDLYDVTIKLEKHPPVLGDNPIEIELKDASGTLVADAKVLVNYYMPPMPRMVPMNYRTDAKLSGGRYKATMNIIMSGPWVIRILITRGEKTFLVKINVDAQ